MALDLSKEIHIDSTHIHFSIRFLITPAIAQLEAHLPAINIAIFLQTMKNMGKQRFPRSFRLKRRTNLSQFIVYLFPRLNNIFIHFGINQVSNWSSGILALHLDR
jgi:hypothetical protein